MSTPFHLFFLAETPYGGFVTYTVHVLRLLRTLGYEPHLWKLTTSSHTRPHPFAESEVYRTVTPRRALTLSYGVPRLITAWQPSAQGELALPLLQARVPLVVHDPNDFSTATAQALLGKSTPRLITIRKANYRTLQAQGADVAYLPHPFVPVSSRIVQWNRQVTWPAICLSRLDWDKHIDLIVQANALLPSPGIRLWGAENRLYTYHKLTAAYPAWRQWYDGPFPKTLDAGVALASRAEAVVDMSRIVGDGGGTQYTFFEAWQASRPLILHQHWLTGADDDEVQPDVNCWVVDSPTTLAEAVQRAHQDGQVLQRGAQATLQAHSALALVPSYGAYPWKE